MFQMVDHILIHRIFIKYDCDETVKSHDFLVGYAVRMGSSGFEH
jgi:hypothetical protein